jgi:GNAT superfamily N-acetyltransferase
LPIRHRDGQAVDHDVKSESELVAAANLNYVGSYRKLVEHCDGAEMREFGGITAFTTRVPVSLFNGCLVLEPSREADLDAALRWMGEWEVPYRVWIAENLVPALGGVALAEGLTRDDTLYPGMVLHPVPESPSPAQGVAVERAHRAAFLEAAIGNGDRPEVATRLFTSSFAEDPDVALFVGYLDGRLVGTSIALRTGDISGIYAVGTHESGRRRGVGTALTWAAVEAGRDWGCDTIVLQASEMGYPIYAAMGFRTVVRYAIYRQPPPPTAG